MGNILRYLYSQAVLLLALSSLNLALFSPIIQNLVLEGPYLQGTEAELTGDKLYETIEVRTSLIW